MDTKSLNGDKNSSIKDQNFRESKTGLKHKTQLQKDTKKRNKN